MLVAGDGHSNFDVSLARIGDTVDAQVLAISRPKGKAPKQQWAHSPPRRLRSTVGPAVGWLVCNINDVRITFTRPAELDSIPIHHPFPEQEVSDLETLAKLAGTRIGLLRAMSEAKLQASTDTLTGLLNRRSFEQKVEELREAGSPISVVMADLDHFKHLNDTYGHPTGDRALLLFAKTLRSSLRAQDVIGRHGGEEFVIAQPDFSAANARKTLDAVRASLDAAVTVAGLPAFTASFGVVELEEFEDQADALERADGALFTAKSEGRHRVVVGDFGSSVVSSETGSRNLRSSGPTVEAIP